MNDIEERIKKILKDFFDKYEAPYEAIEGAALSIVQLINNPMQAKHGAYVMTEAASRAYDAEAAARNKNNSDVAKPQKL